MTKVVWTFLLNNSLSFTSSVLSAQISQGREKYLDNYAGGSISITINNSANLANSFVFNDKILVKSLIGSGGFNEVFNVQEIQFNDYPGNTGLSTATIFAVDPLSRAGRFQATSKALTQVGTIDQAVQFNTVPLPSDLYVDSAYGSTGYSTASAQTYTGTVLNQLNILNATERGQIATSGFNGNRQFIYPLNRQFVSNFFSNSFSFGRNISASVIAYEQFERIQNGLSFINTAEIQPLGLANQTVTNTSSATTYGAAFFSSLTVDFNTTQAQSNGNWIVNGFSDPTDLRFKIRFSDTAQNTAALALFNYGFPFAAKAFNLSYRLPGAVSDLTELVVSEGWQISITPSQTQYQISLSPATYYQYFTLDSSTLGILDTSRLGW